MSSWLKFVCLTLLLLPFSAIADPASFDLTGPTIEVKVTRAGKTLPISAVPNLAAGDKLWIKADLPPDQSAHYLLVAFFLRGATNPPPENWFHESETWNQKGNAGLNVTIPKDAEQALVFLAPETSGDFRTIVGAVQARPGAFVRASQELNQATLDLARLKAYLAAIEKISETDADSLKTASPLLARSLSIKFNSDCLQKTPELQAPCLMQGQDSLILNDGHSASIVGILTSGNQYDLAQQLASTPQARFGYYSPYLASIADIARIMDSFRTAQYQYIPAIATENDDALSLELNTVPSFQNPKSVLVLALPSVQSSQLPPLRPVDPKQVYCAQKTELVLPAEGAPLVYATAYSRDMVLRLKGKNGKTVNLPVKADAEQGGFVAKTAGIEPSNFGDALDGSLHGYWGFDAYDGPEFRLENAHPQHWQIADEDRQSLIAGQDAILHLGTENTACVDSIMLQEPNGNSVKADWKQTSPNQVAVTLPLKKAHPGALKLLVNQYGSKDPDTISLEAFAPAGRLDSFTLHAGDAFGVLKGNRLEEVKTLSLNGVSFTPGELAKVEGSEELRMTASDAKAAEGMKAGEGATAQVSLKDGRSVSLETEVAPPRPAVTLIGKSIQPSSLDESQNLQLVDPNEVPQGDLLTFSIHAVSPASFTGNETVEVATEQGAYLYSVTMANGLTLEDAQVALATLDTSKAFANSASGPLRFRLVENGVAGEWQPLAILVRLPMLRDLNCSGAADQPCQLNGDKLYLVDSIASDAQFTNAIKVPEGFTGNMLSVPRPATGELFVRLHDAPAIVNSVMFPVKAPAHGASRADKSAHEAASQGTSPAGAEYNAAASAASNKDSSAAEDTPQATGAPANDAPNAPQGTVQPAQPAPADDRPPPAPHSPGPSAE